MSMLVNLVRSHFRTLKKINYISWILPSEKFINDLRNYYRQIVSFPFLFYVLHPNCFYKGVLAGSFIGTRFSPKTSWNFAPYFFLGTYEKELEGFWNYLTKANNKLKNIVIIGAAEGYYVCGLGRICQESSIIAYESSDESRRILELNLRINNLSERVTVLGNCDYPEFYSQLKAESPDFILCDIEGYENTLFTEQILQLLVNTILLIEVHPSYELLTKIPQIENTHKVFKIEPETRTLEDYTVFDLASKAKKYEWMNERRPFSTPWILALPNNHQSTMDFV
ncbi:hypothetical protein [Anabaena sp. UHCC 0204]|uniref:hypothetical protein n=1 Tax=Anabaena sp. UHCC 0204 TaxID=2590009 RepID=UPI00144886CD|nr:hypothetical protein [Anabaena sp. UHCC 0204]MTJ07925.1 hypothetical protein [Anabaena sp. UHCC 0204]